MCINKNNILSYQIPINIAMILFSLIISASFIFDWLAIEVLRYISISILLLQICFEIITKNKFFLTSPLFILSSLSLVFFSFLLGITLNLHEPIYYQRVMIAAGSDAERYIAAFALITLATHMLVLLVTNIKLQSVEIKYIQKNEVVFRLFIFFISILTLFNVYFFYTASDLTATLNISLRHLLPPLQAFMIFFLIRRTFISGKKLTLLTVFSFCIFFVGMFAVHEGKIPIFIGIVALFYWLRLTKITLGKTSLCLLITLIIGLAGLQLTSVMRSPEGSIKTFFTGSPTTELAHGNIPRVLRAPLLKILYRQSATVYCFKKVLDYGSDAPFTLSDQFFWIKGLVPRILWSEKPKLSGGQLYTQKYCGQPTYSHHNSSITLLGQPFIIGGNIGLFLNIGLLIFGLAGITLLTRQPLGLSTLSVVALSPWLIDMDQNFVLYVANLVKFFLIILPLIIITGLAEKNQNIMRFKNLLRFCERKN